MREKLGQHFLINKSALKKIASSLDIKSGDVVVEIGTGHGELSVFLAEECASKKNTRLIMVEKDKILADALKKRKFKISNLKFKIVEGDIIKILPTLVENWKLKIGNSSYKIAGNIPYYITGRLLRILSELPAPPAITVLTIQKEVAERLSAAPPDMNLLAAIVQFWAKPQIIMRLKPDDFLPSPEVESAIVKLEISNKIQDTRYKKIRSKYYKTAKTLFKQPRKTILNNLSSGLGKSKPEITKTLQKLVIDPALRPQNLDVPTITRIAEKLENGI